MQNITVFLIDKYVSMLIPSRSLLETQRDFIVVGEVTDRLSAASAVAHCCPDVVVLNMTLPIEDTLDAVRSIHTLCPSTRVILLALFLKDEDVRQAIGVGVQGFVSYEAITSELVKAIRTVVAGEPFLSRNLADYGEEVPLPKHGHQKRFDFGLPGRPPQPLGPFLFRDAD